MTALCVGHPADQVRCCSSNLKTATGRPSTAMLLARTDEVLDRQCILLQCMSRLMARNGRSMHADGCLFLVEKRSCSGHHRKDRFWTQPGHSKHSLALSALVTDRVMEAWYHPSIA